MFTGGCAPCSGGGCPNQRGGGQGRGRGPSGTFTPLDWYNDLPPATQTLLKLIFIVSVSVTMLSSFFPDILSFDEEREQFAGGQGSDAQSALMRLFYFLVKVTSFVPLSLLDFTPVFSLSFLFDMYFFATFMSKVELDVYGGYVLDFFEFPGADLFTKTQLAALRDDVSRRNNILVRSLRTVWGYLQLSLGLFIAYCAICAPFHILLCVLGLTEVPDTLSSFFEQLLAEVRPSKLITPTICAVWCFLAPEDTRLQIPFASLFAPRKKGMAESAPTGRSSTSVGEAGGAAASSARDSQASGDNNEGSAAPSSSSAERPQASDRRQNASYASYVSDSRRSMSAQRGVKARHYPLVVALIHWVMSGGSVMGLARELVAVYVVARVYTRMLSDRRGRDQNAVPERAHRFGVKIIDKSVGVNSLLARGLSGLEKRIFGGGEGSNYLSKGLATVRGFIKGNIMTFVPKHSLDVPRPICRYVKRALTTDKIDELKKRGALTPWAH